MFRYVLSSVGQDLELERKCPHCHRNKANIHSSIILRSIRDIKVSAVAQRRLKCPFCGITWTLRSQGIADGRQRSQRLRGLGVILYMLGLSYRAVEKFLPCLDCPSGKSSIERDVAEFGQKARQYHLSAPRMRIKILGVDGTGAALAGKNAGILFFTDIEAQKLVLVEAIQETDSVKLRRHVAKVMAAVGAQELRSDEHSAYRGIVSQDRHRLCLTHWLKSKAKRASDLYRQALAENRPLETESMKRLLEILRLNPRPPTVPVELERLVRSYIHCRRGLLWKINQLLQHVERTWSQVSNDTVDPTNNVTERLIGLTFKIRAKTMRGFKSQRKVLDHIYLSSFLRGDKGVCDLRKVS